jgi:ribosome-binding protein aMBF1 (putative translation factor)
MNWEDHKKELLKDPRIRKALKETRLEYEVARQLILARLKKNMTQQILARKLKTKQSVISRVESGKHLPSLSFLHRLASAMGTSLTISFGN